MKQASPRYCLSYKPAIGTAAKSRTVVLAVAFAFESTLAFVPDELSRHPRLPRRNSLYYRQGNRRYHSQGKLYRNLALFSANSVLYDPSGSALTHGPSTGPVTGLHSGWQHDVLRFDTNLESNAHEAYWCDSHCRVAQSTGVYAWCPMITSLPATTLTADHSRKSSGPRGQGSSSCMHTFAVAFLQLIGRRNDTESFFAEPCRCKIAPLLCPKLFGAHSRGIDLLSC